MRRAVLSLGVWILVVLSGVVRSARAEDAPPVTGDRTILLAHYMPWFMAKPHSTIWGWHWTMNAFDPDQKADGKFQLASHFQPLIGPYDSGDPDVLEYHLLTMKLAGIDGVIVDWYGLADFRDYAFLHMNTRDLIEQATRLGVSFAICYEDQTIPALVEDRKLAPADRVRHAVGEIVWMDANWFAKKGYVRVEGRPVLLSFGQAGLTEAEWTEVLGQLSTPVSYFSEHLRRTAAVGAFDWPVPKEGMTANQRFHQEAKAWKHSIPVAFPRFVDIYAEAKVHESWGRVEDRDGATFRETLELALQRRPAIVQIATWNDWGEGTQIEPSREYGYRDLECVQELRRKHVDTQFASSADDLKLPLRLLQLRRQLAGDTDKKNALEDIASRLVAGEIARAKAAILNLEAQTPSKNR